MGRQSSRIFYQGKDHKDIYFQGHYHDAMYIGNQLVWEKLDGKLEPILYEDISVGVPEDHREMHVKDMVSTVYGSVVFRTQHREDFSINGSGYLFYYEPDNPYHFISGNNTALKNGSDVLFPDNGLYVANARTINGDAGRETLVYAFSNVLYWAQKFRRTEPSYLLETMEMLNMKNGSNVEGIQYYIDGAPVEKNAYANACYINIGGGFSQYFAGAVHADVSAGVGYPSKGVCSSTDGVNWSTGSKVTGTGTVVGGILFCDNGDAINQQYEPVSYSMKPAIYVNGWYYAEELERGYLMRSTDLNNWERYKNIEVRGDYKVSGYWRTKNLLCLKKENDNANGEAGIYKYKIHL